jgi:hypothetical protein
MLRIALPNKGRLADEARELFTDAGLEVRVRGDRALTASLGGEFEAIFVRAQDIPEFVADGAADAGVTGWDLLCESERALDTLLDLGFGALPHRRGDTRRRAPARRAGSRWRGGRGRTGARGHRVPAHDAWLLRRAGGSPWTWCRSRARWRSRRT